MTLLDIKDSKDERPLHLAVKNNLVAHTPKSCSNAEHRQMEPEPTRRRDTRGIHGSALCGAA